jgi:uncharacterized repeat protein (TIGR02543 family)
LDKTGSGVSLLKYKEFATEALISEGVAVKPHDVEILCMEGGFFTEDLAPWIFSQSLGELVTVTFNPDNGSAVTTQVVTKGVTISALAAPAKTGYTFTGWYAPAATASFDFKTPITANLTLTAQWSGGVSPNPGGGGSSGGGVATYTVTFNSQGGAAVASASVAVGAKVTKPATDPTREGYTFAGWYTDAEGTAAYDFDKAVTASFTLYAKWTEGETAPAGPLDAFSDKSLISDWAVPFITKLVSAKILEGRTDGTLDPKGDVTRAEFTKLIVLGLNIKAGESPKGFTDVTSHWSKEFVDIASSKQIVLGVSDTAFAPDSRITREQIAAIAYRALQSLNVTLPEVTTTAFADEGKVSAYALDAVRTLKQLVIIAGRDTGLFDPKAYATREETAKIISGLIDYVASPAAAPTTPVDQTTDTPAPAV